MNKLLNKIDLILSLARLGWGWFDFFKIIMGYILISIVWKVYPHDVSIPVALRFNNKRLEIFLTSYADLLSLKEVFLEEEYSLAESGDIRIVLDAGVHVGFDALYFWALYPEVRILCVEPDPRTFTKLQRNVKKYSNIRIYNIGFGGKDTVEPFFSSNHDSIASSFVVDSRDGETINIPIKTIKTFMAEEGLDHVDVLKFDIEGMEVDMLRGCDGLDIKHFIGEIHFDLITEDKEWFEEYFSDYTLTMKPIATKRAMLEAVRQKG